MEQRRLTPNRRISDREFELLNRINTDYCKEDRKSKQEINDVLYEIKYYGEIGGHRL